MHHHQRMHLRDVANSICETIERDRAGRKRRAVACVAAIAAALCAAAVFADARADRAASACATQAADLKP